MTKKQIRIASEEALRRRQLVLLDRKFRIGLDNVEKVESQLIGERLTAMEEEMRTA